MRISTKIKPILLLLFLLGFLSSCGDKCIEEEEFYDQQLIIYGNPEDNKTEKINTFGEYNHYDGGQTREWQNTGLFTSGDGFVILVSGEMVATGGEGASNNDLSSFPPCKLCFKEKNSITIESDNCYCGPYIKDGVYSYENPTTEEFDQEGKSVTSAGINCGSNTSDQNDINKCSCKPYTGSQYLHENSFISFEKEVYSKTIERLATTLSPIIKPASQQSLCKFSMGYGLYISLWGRDGYTTPQKAYHLFTTSKAEDKNKFCPSNILKSSDKCQDEKGNSKWVFIYKSPDGKIFKKNDTEYHQENEAIKINFNDQFYGDNKGYYKLQFIKGAWQKENTGLFTNIVTEMEEFLFGAQVYDAKSGRNIKKDGVVEFMYKAVIKDPYVSKIILIGLVIYVTFFGMAFLMGIVELNKKEIMMRLLKIGLVVMFTNPNAWQFYNIFVVGFFKDGMNSIISLVVQSYSTIIEQSYLDRGITPSALKAGSNFIVIDGLAKDMLSDSATQKIFSLLNMDKGKGFFALIYIPAIYFIIFYFLYTMLDVVIKYIINLVKICIGLALGPVFIFFSLFEKTKDMFKNWLSFMGSRSLEIIILFALLHPFIKIIDVLFKEMLRYKICPIGLSGNLDYVLSFKTFMRPENVHNRSIFTWFEYFLKIGAMIFLTKSLADRSSYISGQIVSIGGISNADSVSEVGKGEGGFSLGGSIAKAMVGSFKQFGSSKYFYGAIAKVSRVAVKSINKALRAEVVGDKSINDLVNIAFKKVGIRNRGVRSFMRDRQIDKFIGEANAKAESMGLESGKAREEFVRKTVSQKANAYINANKNSALLLGIDQENIMHRMNQKLVKDPLKNFIKAEAQRQKALGKIGLEAEKAIKEKAKEWAKNYFVDEERTVSKFFKKSSIKSFVKKQSLMSASNAFEYAKNLKEVDQEKYDKFVEKFRDATNQNAIRRKARFDENEKTIIGKVKNKVDQAYGVINNINPLYEGAHKLNPKKTLRKFDRKLKRLNDFEVNKQNQAQQPAPEGMKEKVKVALKNSFNDQNEFLASKKDDNIAVKIIKFVPNLVSKPFTKIAKSYQNRTFKKAEFKDDHDINQVESYRRLAKSFDAEGKTYRKSRQELEQTIKAIDKYNSKNPQLIGETYLEKLSDGDRIKFQEEVNKRIGELGLEILSDPTKQAENIAEIKKLKNAIFQDVEEYNADRTKIKFLGMEFDCKGSVQVVISDSATPASGSAGDGSQASDSARVVNVQPPIQDPNSSNSSSNNANEKLENLMIEAHKKFNTILKALNKP